MDRLFEKVMEESAAVLFYKFLLACHHQGLTPPKGSAYVVADEALIDHLCYTVVGPTTPGHQTVKREVVASAFLGLPVKQVFGVVRGTVLKIPEVEERDLMLRRYARKRSARATP